MISPPDTKFQTLKEAWTELSHILSKILALRGNTPPHQDLAAGPTNHGNWNSELVPLQQHLQTSLQQWHTTYLSSKPHLDPSEPTLVITATMMSYHTLAAILCATSLSSELAYDAHTTRFLVILSNAIHLWKTRSPPKTCDEAGFDMSHSIVDVAWVAPLYYTAIKCRVRRVRLHAVRLLESTMHREGIWDCRVMSRIMRRVMEIEDEGLYEGDGGGFALDVVPGLDELGRPVLPLERRIAEIKLGMED
jgi:hypothetical protein